MNKRKRQKSGEEEEEEATIETRFSDLLTRLRQLPNAEAARLASAFSADLQLAGASPALALQVKADMAQLADMQRELAAQREYVAALELQLANQGTASLRQQLAQQVGLERGRVADIQHDIQTLVHKLEETISAVETALGAHGPLQNQINVVSRLSDIYTVILGTLEQNSLLRALDANHFVNAALAFIKAPPQRWTVFGYMALLGNMDNAAEPLATLFLERYVAPAQEDFKYAQNIYTNLQGALNPAPTTPTQEISSATKMLGVLEEYGNSLGVALENAKTLDKNWFKTQLHDYYDTFGPAQTFLLAGQTLLTAQDQAQAAVLAPSGVSSLSMDNVQAVYLFYLIHMSSPTVAKVPRNVVAVLQAALVALIMHDYWTLLEGYINSHPGTFIEKLKQTMPSTFPDLEQEYNVLVAQHGTQQSDIHNWLVGRYIAAWRDNPRQTLAELSEFLQSINEFPDRDAFYGKLCEYLNTFTTDRLFIGDLNTACIESGIYMHSAVQDLLQNLLDSLYLPPWRTVNLTDISQWTEYTKWQKRVHAAHTESGTPTTSSLMRQQQPLEKQKS